MVLLIMKQKLASVHKPSFDKNYASGFVSSKSKAWPLYSYRKYNGKTKFLHGKLWKTLCF